MLKYLSGSMTEMSLESYFASICGHLTLSFLKTAGSQKLWHSEWQLANKNSEIRNQGTSEHMVRVAYYSWNSFPSFQQFLLLLRIFCSALVNSVFIARLLSYCQTSKPLFGCVQLNVPVDLKSILWFLVSLA